MAEYVDLSERVSATFYSDEYEEWTQQTVTIADVLDSVCDDYTVLPSAQPDLDEWCTDCKEYDPKRHSCPRYNRVIREALNGAEPRKPGKWIPVTRIEEWGKENGLTGFPPEVAEFPNCTIKYVDATEPDEVDAVRYSECGTVYDFTEARNWCSECGADMRGENEKCG